MKRHRQLKRNIGIFFTIAAVVVLGVFYARIISTSSRTKMLNTLSEVSSQSKGVLQKEIEKEKTILKNLAIYIGQSDIFEWESAVDKLKSVDHVSNFKRMGIILPDGTAYTTDGYLLHLEERDYFQDSMNGHLSVSDTLIDQAGGEDITVYSAPIINSGTTVAVLFATYSTKLYQTSLAVSTFGGEGYSYVVKPDGSCIITSDHPNSFGAFGNIFSMLENASVENQQMIQQLKQAMENQEAGSITFKSEQKNYMYYQPLEINDWYLLSVIPSHIVQKDSSDILLITYIFTAACVIIFIILILRIGRVEEVSRKALEEIAFVDKITSGPTYDKFKLVASEYLGSAAGPYAVVCLDIDKFKYINDLYGFKEGNNALRLIWNLVKNNTFSGETCARYNGDHFVMLWHYSSDVTLKNRINKFYQNVNGRKSFNEKYFDFKITIGIYEQEADVHDIDTMIDRATIALNSAKGSALKPIAYYDNLLRKEMVYQKELENKFEEAVKNHEFLVYYQPKFNIKRNCFDSAEALVRWKDTSGRMTYPNDFIPVYEKNGFVVNLDEYIFENVCSNIRGWLDQGIPVLPVSINISRLHLYQKDFVIRYMAIIQKYNIPTRYIQLELTETVIFDNEEILTDILSRFRGFGIKILMDDFGSGYSSINMLQMIPVDILKIDKLLVDGSIKNKNSRKILRSIVSLASDLGLEVVAEGVETKEQFDFLKSLGCDAIQGYYCSRPVSQEDYVRDILLK